MPVYKCIARLAAVSLAAAVLAACDSGGIGQGNALQSLSIVKLGGVLGPASTKSHVCFFDRLQLIGTFTDGARGDFSARARWTSSDPSKLQVSNGELPIDPSDVTQGTFAFGIVVPKQATAEGETVRISAEFVGLTASYDATVGNPESLRIVPGSQASVEGAPQTQNILVGSAEALLALVTIDGFKLNVSSSFPLWQLVETTAGTAASIGQSNGVLRGNAAGGPFKARARFPTCEDSADPAVTNFLAGNEAAFQVRAVADPGLSLNLSHEFDETTATHVGQLIVGTSERLRVAAAFADGGADQDVSSQILLETAAAEGVDTSSIQLNALGLRSAVGALSAGTEAIPVRARYGVDDPDTADVDESVASNTLGIQAVAGTLQGVEIRPETASIDALDVQQFRAIGRFEGDVIQDISRSAAWNSSDTGVALVSSAGVAQSQAASAGTADITATSTLPGTTVLSDTARLCVFLPSTPEAERLCEAPAATNP